MAKTRILLDTHVVIHLLTDPEKVPSPLREQLETAPVFVSSASTWEMAIKISRGKLRIPKNFFEELDRLEFERLSISLEHTRALLDLPPIHADPFDRILIAQAQVEGVVIATEDRTIKQYPGVRTLWD